MFDSVRAKLHPAERSSGTACAFFRTVTCDNPDEDCVKPFTHPEVSSNSAYCIEHIRSKPSLGICLSGGGFRATTCAAGWIRGLDMVTMDDGTSVLSNAQYMSSTSGGSWFNAAFSYEPTADKPKKMKDFVEPYREAASLNLKMLQQEHPKATYEAAIARHNTVDTLLSQMSRHWLPGADAVQDVGEWLVDLFSDTANDAYPGLSDQQKEHLQHLLPWTRAVTEAFLVPFNLAASKDATVSAAGTRDSFAIRRAQANASNVLLACTDVDKPFPIMTGTVFNPPGDDGYRLYPLEFSPLYFGTPGMFPYSEPSLGGGYMEPWGLNAAPLSGLKNCSTDGCTGFLDLTHADPDTPVKLYTVPLCQAMSISSSFLAVAASNRTKLAQQLASTENFVNWGVKPSKATERPDYGVMGFADGGCLDNCAIMPLLRRGVKCLVVLMASSTPPDDTWELFAREKSDLAALFGSAKASGIPDLGTGELNDMCRVFGKDNIEGEKMFRELFHSLNSKLRAGQPGFHRGSYMVHENRFFHIPASTEPVEVLWIHNQQWAMWERKLPKETHDLLQKHRKGESGTGGVHHKSMLKREKLDGQLQQGVYNGFGTQNDLYRFPYFTTYALDYSTDAVRLLSQLATAVLLHDDVKGHLKDLVATARKKTDESVGQKGASVKTEVPAKVPVLA